MKRVFCGLLALALFASPAYAGLGDNPNTNGGPAGPADHVGVGGNPTPAASGGGGNGGIAGN